MKIAVLANGEWESEWGRCELESVDYLVCADGGGNSALLSGRIPDVLIGDLDSITPENLEKCYLAKVEIQQYPREKDQTDLELALEWAIEKAGTEQEIFLYGGTGGRIDHLLGNIALLLAHARRGRIIRVKDPKHEMWLLQGREIIYGEKEKELSLIVLSETAVVTTEGLYYSLDHACLVQDSPRTISNVFLGEEAVVQVDAGWVLAIMLN
ncbi:MAG: thiamine diphosphokinase [Desulfitobacteriaceae bacterium]